MTAENVTVGGYNAVGPLQHVYHHAPVTVISADQTEGVGLAVCLACGYTARGTRSFSTVRCARERNPINQTWGEFLAENDYPSDDRETVYADTEDDQ